MKSSPGSAFGIPHFRRSGRPVFLASTLAIALGCGFLGVGPAFAETGEDHSVVNEIAPAPTNEVTGASAESDTAPLSSTASSSTATSAPTATATSTAIAIAEVQGTTDVSPMVGQTVTVEGVITADYRSGGYKGVVIQTQGSGGASTEKRTASDGIFVYLNGKAVPDEIGDLISVTGKVSENYGQTQIAPASVSDVALVTTQAGLPELTPLPTSVRGGEREAYENMLVSPAGSYLVASTHQLHNYGALWLSPEELAVKSTQTERPGSEADAIAKTNRQSRILLDDGYSIQTSNKDYPGSQPYFTNDQVVRTGDTVDFGGKGFVLQYGFDDWRLQPVRPISSVSAASEKVGFTSTNPRVATPPVVGGDVKVGAFNVYNYFTTLQSDNSNARGAKNAQEFAVQKSKIVAAINGLDADIVSLMEVENPVKLGGKPDAALADLVEGLNTAAGSNVWAYVPTPKELLDPTITDYITSAIIYKPAKVTPEGASSTVVDESVWGNAREPIAQAFDIGGRTVTVVSNHFKSKSGTGAEPADGQGHFNADRVKQANSLLSFTEKLKTQSKSDDLLLIGDFNAYGKEDPIDVFTSKGWVDTVAAKSPNAHTYGFNGELGSLDHVLASPSLAASVTGADVWSINSAEWGDRGYAYGAAEAGTPFRSSDHDPILVGLLKQAPPVSIDIATINDFHGRIEANGASAGAAVVAGAVQEFRKNNPNTIFAAAGDLIGASTFTSFIQGDTPTIEALNLAGLEVSATGNHEFDQGWKDLRDRVMPLADWEYISANVFVTETGKPALAPSWVKDVQGVRVGFVGAVTEDLESLVSAEGMKGLEVRSIVDSVNKAADELKDGDLSNGEADVIILLVHEGAATAKLDSITPDSPLGKIVAGVDSDVNAIVSAHTHLAYNHVIDGRPVVSAGQYGENLGLMNLKVDPKTKKLLSITNEIKPLTSGGAPLYPAVTEVQEKVKVATDLAKTLGSQKVGEITADFNRALQSDGKSENRGGESTIGNFVADAHKWATGADLALMNPGGIRANMKAKSSGEGDPDGNLTYREAADVQPFANTLVTQKLTGAQIVAILEEQWQPAQASRPFLKLGLSKGLTYQYDPLAEKGEHITAVFLNGKPLDLDAHYVVAANAFLAAGGDNFSTFAQGVEKKDTGRSDLQSMVDWFSVNKSATPDYAPRALGVHISADGETKPEEANAARVALTSPAARLVALLTEPTETGFKAGDQVSLAVSSLAFSAGEPAPATVEALVDGRVVAAQPVTTAVVDKFSETGSALLTFTAPDTVSAGSTLTLRTNTGSLSSIPAIAAIKFVGSSGSENGGSTPGEGNQNAGGSGQNTSGTNATQPASLAHTGFDATWYSLIGIALLLLGAGGVLTARRREG